MANEYAIRYKLILGAVNYVQCTLNKIYTFNMWVKNVCSFYLFYHGRLGFCSCRDDVAMYNKGPHRPPEQKYQSDVTLIQTPLIILLPVQFC